MSLSIKSLIQQSLIRKKQTEYREECRKQVSAYEEFACRIQQKRKQQFASYHCRQSIAIIDATECRNGFNPNNYKEDILLFLSSNGQPVTYIKEAVCEYFDTHAEIELMYPDEDYRLRSGLNISFAPVNKPCFAPETLLSYNYIGEVFAVRRSSLQSEDVFTGEDAELAIYDFLLRLTEHLQKIGHMEEVLFHRYADDSDMDDAKDRIRKEDQTIGSSPKFRSVKEAAFARRAVKGIWIEQENMLFPEYEAEQSAMVSILIPSKDNADVLMRCIKSVREYTKDVSYQIVVVDNGSCEETKSLLQEYARKDGFIYIYNQMDFNFSSMINIAAKSATGKWFLLLNDDIEVIQEDWLRIMLGQAMQAGIGCVGAKLLYPNSHIIQHVGVTNAIDGPVHKLIGSDDTQSYYRGRNRLVYDVIAVTGACLLVSAEQFKKYRGLDEELRVAYNDVDLCFSLFESGYRNVIRNDVVLYHHESLSRGQDAMSAEKMLRLKEERDYLYHKHPSLYYTDPYEGAFNSGGADFALRPEYGIGEKKPADMRMQECKSDYRTLPAGIVVHFERVEKEDLLKTYEGEFYVISGWAVLPEGDNSRYEFKMVFLGKNTDYEMKMKKYYQADLSSEFPNALNIALAGFFSFVTVGEVEAGEYEIAIFAKDTCSRQKLLQKTGKMITIEGNEQCR